MRLSWWPTEDLWAKSPFGERGYWSTAAEYWFQKRLQDLKDGKLKPRNASEWKKALAGHKKAQYMEKNGRIAANQFLNNLGPIRYKYHE